MRKVSLVTGGSRGLGREIALSLGRLGHEVIVNYLKEDSEAQKTAKEAGGCAFKADVGELRQVEAMASFIKQKWGRLDVLVNNAGITRDALLLRLSEADWDEVIKTNLKGCFNTARALAPLMIDSGGGHIINVSSLSGLRGRPAQAAYSASKAAVVGLTLALSRELAEHGVRVNALMPGYMSTAMGAASVKAMRRAKEESLAGKLSEPSEAAGFVAWLVGTSGITGQVFRLDSRP